MKRILLVILLLAATAVAQNAPAAPSAPAPYGWRCLDRVTDKGGLKARELLEQMATAMGGEPWLSYSTITQEGRSFSFFQGRPTNTGTPFWRFVKLPDQERAELTKQRDVVYIYNGEKGYELSYKGTAAMDAKDVAEYLRRRAHSLETVLRVWLADPSTTVLYLGTGLSDRRLAEMVSVITSKNEDMVFYIDPNSHRLVQKNYHYRSEDGYKDEESELYGNYRAVQGIQTPFTVTRFLNGEITNQRFINNVSYNNPLDGKIFEATVTYDPYHYREKNK